MQRRYHRCLVPGSLSARLLFDGSSTAVPALSFQFRPCAASSSSSSNRIPDLDDDDRIFNEALARQQQQQLDSASATTSSSSSSQEAEAAIKREKTNLFIRIVTSVGIVPLPLPLHLGADGQRHQQHHSTNRPIENTATAVETVRDMIFAAVKLRTLTAHHLRRMFAQCGDLQREEPLREMWIRMLTIVKTVLDAEQVAFFDASPLYNSSSSASDVAGGGGGVPISAAEGKSQNLADKKDDGGLDEDDDYDFGDVPQRRSSPPPHVAASIVEPAAWNALLGLSIEFVVKKRSAGASASSVAVTAASAGGTSSSSSGHHHQHSRAAAAHTTTSTASRAVLESELELVLGSGRSDEPHWWVVSEMDRRGVAVTNPTILRFLSAEIDTASFSSKMATRNPHKKREEAVAQLSDQEAAAVQRAPEIKRAVVDSRVKLLSRLEMRR